MTTPYRQLVRPPATIEDLGHAYRALTGSEVERAIERARCKPELLAALYSPLQPGPRPGTTRLLTFGEFYDLNRIRVTLYSAPVAEPAKA